MILTYDDDLKYNIHHLQLQLELHDLVKIYQAIYIFFKKSKNFNVYFQSNKLI